MSDEHKLNQAAVRASRAKLLLEDELIIEAFSTIRSDYITKLLATTTMQADAREKLYIGVKILDEVQNHLAIIVENGKVAISDLTDLAQVAERKKRFGIV